MAVHHDNEAWQTLSDGSGGYGWLHSSNGNYNNIIWNLRTMFSLSSPNKSTRTATVSINNLCIYSNSGSGFNVNITGTFSVNGNIQSINQTIAVNNSGSNYLYDTDDDVVFKNNKLATGTISYNNKGYPIGSVIINLTAKIIGTNYSINYNTVISGSDSLGGMDPDFKDPMKPTISINKSRVNDGDSIKIEYTGQSNKTSVDDTKIIFETSNSDNETKQFSVNEGTSTSSGSKSVSVNTTYFPLSSKTDSKSVYIRAKRHHNVTNKESGWSPKVSFTHMVVPTKSPTSIKVSIETSSGYTDISNSNSTYSLSLSSHKPKLKVSAYYNYSNYGIVSGYYIAIFKKKSDGTDKRIAYKYVETNNGYNLIDKEISFDYNDKEDTELFAYNTYYVSIKPYYKGSYYTGAQCSSDSSKSGKFGYMTDISNISPKIEYPKREENTEIMHILSYNNKIKTRILFKLPEDPDAKNNQFKYSDIIVTINNSSVYYYSNSSHKKYFNTSLSSGSKAIFMIPNLDSITSIKIKVVKSLGSISYESGECIIPSGKINIHNMSNELFNMYIQNQIIISDDINKIIYLSNILIRSYINGNKETKDDKTLNNVKSEETKISKSDFVKIQDKLTAVYNKINNYCDYTDDNTSALLDKITGYNIPIKESDLYISAKDDSDKHKSNIFILMLNVLRIIIS